MFLSTTSLPFFVKFFTIVFFQIAIASSLGNTPDNMKKAVYIAEFVLPGNPAFNEISLASIRYN